MDNDYAYQNGIEKWKLMGYWPKIIERVHILDRNMDLIFEKKYIKMLPCISI